jgi:tetratricopeptide (TPR) repeat protein
MMELTLNEKRYKFIDLIMKERNVTYKSVYDCIEKKQKEIDNMDKIFDKNDNISKKKRLVSLTLLSMKKRAEENLEFYQREDRIKTTINDNDIENYKTIIIAALMTNDIFYVSASNWCGIIQREVGKIRRNNITQAEKELKLNFTGLVAINILGILIYTRYLKKTQMMRSDNSFNSTNYALNITADEFDAIVKKHIKEIEANPNDPNTYIKLGCLYINRNESGDSGRAFEYSNNALTIDKENPKALCIRGLAYYEMGEYKKALDDLRTVIDMNIPNKEGVYYTIGKIYYQDGKWKEACETFKKVMALNKEFADVNEILADIKKILRD